MAKNKKNSTEDKAEEMSKDLSIDELVNLLRDNISSEEIEYETESNEKEQKMKKAQDPDKDIASMLKKFIPDEDNASDDFELDDVSNDVLSDDADFEFEAETAPEGEYDIELTPAYASSDAVGEFEFDDGSDIFGEEFSEPDAAVIDDFIPEDDSVLEAVSFENEPEIPEKKKKLGGLFGMGKKKGISLADGYAKMLEEEMALKSEEASSDISEAPSVSDPVQLGFDHLDEQPESKTSEYAYTSDSSMEGSAINETNSKISEFLTSDMPEIESISDEMSDNSSVSQKDEEIILESTSSGEPAPSQMFVFDSEAGTEEPEDEYFAPEKNPLAFDNDDDTPIVPDESAFADVAASDVSAFENEAPEEEISNIAENSEGLDDKDINLMLALGYEDELEKAIGKENVDVISDQLNAEIVDFIDVDNTYAFDGFELNSPDSFRAVGNKYKQEHSLMKLRLLGTGIFTAALFLFELLAMFGVSFGGALNANQYPVVAIMISLQFLVLAASMSWKQILAGLYDAVTFTPSPASIPSVALVMTVVYDIIMALISPYTGLQLYNFPAALCVLMLVLNDYFNLSREIRSFNTIATRRPKYAVSTVNPADKSAEEEMMYIFGEESDSHYDDKILEVRKVGFIDNYFRRSNIRSAKDRRLCLAIFPFIALSIALGVVSFVTNKNGVTAFNISILTVLFGLPMSALFTMSYPFFSAVKTAFAKDATIIGEESVEEYSDATSVKVADKEVFPTEATVTKGIKLYDNNAIYYVLYHLTSLYSKIGGPLKERLEQATTEMGHSDNVEILHVAQKGIEAVVDGKVHVLAGQASYMGENNISVGYDPDDDRMLGEGASTLYLVLDGVLSAKLYVSYEIDPEFQNVVSSLAEEHMEVIIRTSDPNIDDELLNLKLPVSQFPVRIVKCFPGENADVKTAEAGIVSRNSLTALASTIALCNKIRRVRKTAKKISVISTVISIVIMVFLALFSSELEVFSIYVALYQVFWMIPTLLFTKLYVK